MSIDAETLSEWRKEAGHGVCSDPRKEFGRDYRIIALLDEVARLQGDWAGVENTLLERTLQKWELQRIVRRQERQIEHNESLDYVGLAAERDALQTRLETIELPFEYLGEDPDTWVNVAASLAATGATEEQALVVCKILAQGRFLPGDAERLRLDPGEPTFAVYGIRMRFLNALGLTPYVAQAVCWLQTRYDRLLHRPRHHPGDTR